MIRLILIFAITFSINTAYAGSCDDFARFAWLGALAAKDGFAKEKAKERAIESASKGLHGEERKSAVYIASRSFDIGFNSGEDPEKVKAYAKSICIKQ